MISAYYDAPTHEGSDLMRGADERTGAMFSYVSLEERVPADHPLRAVRRITDRALERLSPRFGTLYVKFGRPSVPPEKLLPQRPMETPIKRSGCIAIRRFCAIPDAIGGAARLTDS